MGTYGLQEVIRRWGRGQLTPELDKRLQELERRRDPPSKRPPRKTGP
jgi:hypothetical protein